MVHSPSGTFILVNYFLWQIKFSGEIFLIYEVDIINNLIPRKSALGGVTSGAFAQFCASPTDLIKVQIQMEGRRRLLGKPPR